MGIKVCDTCKEEKTLDNFYKRGGGESGYRSKCKACFSSYQRRPGVVERKRKNNQRYSRTEKGIISKKKSQENSYIRKRELGRHAVYRAVQKALKTGKLKRKPCEECGTKKNIHAHHDDYSKPLDVRWLCHIHHAEVHYGLD